MDNPSKEDAPNLGVRPDGNEQQSAAADDAFPIPDDDPGLIGDSSRALVVDPSGVEEPAETGEAPRGGVPALPTDLDQPVVDGGESSRGFGDAESGAVPQDFESSDAPGELGIGAAAAPLRDVAQRARDLGFQLRRIEEEVRNLVEPLDPRRKRKLSGTRRWHELQDDIMKWRFSGNLDDDVLKRLSNLIQQRHDLFRRLSFLAGTRPTWNS